MFCRRRVPALSDLCSSIFRSRSEIICRTATTTRSRDAACAKRIKRSDAGAAHGLPSYRAWGNSTLVLDKVGVDRSDIQFYCRVRFSNRDRLREKRLSRTSDADPMLNLSCWTKL